MAGVIKVIRGKLVSQPYEKGIIAGEEFDGGEDANIDEDREVGGEYNSNGSDDFCSDSGVGNDVNMGVGGNEVVGGVGVAAKCNVKGSGDRRRFAAEGGVVEKGKHSVAVEAVSLVEGDVGGIVCATRVERIGDGKEELETALAELYALRTKCRLKDGMIAELQAEVDQLRRMKEKQAVDIVGGFTLVFKVKEDEIKKVVEENVELRKTIGVLEEQLAKQDVHNVTQAFHKVANGDIDTGEGNDVGRKEGVTLDSVGQRGNNVLKKGDNCGVVDEMTSGVEVEVSGNGSDVVEVARCVTRRQPMEGVESSFVRNLKGKVSKELLKPDFEYGGVGKMMVGCGKVVDSKVVDVLRTGVRSGNAGWSIDVDACAVRSREWSGFDLNNHLGVWKLMTAVEKGKIRNAYDKDGDRAVMWASSGHDVCVYFADIKSLLRPSSLRGNVIDAYVVLLMEEQNRLAVGVEFSDKSYVFSSICLGIVLQRDTILEIQRGAIGGLGDDDATQFGGIGVEAITDCPQQRHDSSLQEDNCVILRANMVKGFVNDHERVVLYSVRAATVAVQTQNPLHLPHFLIWVDLGLSPNSTNVSGSVTVFWFFFMGCVTSKQAVSVTPAFDHSGAFRDNAAVGTGGRSRGSGVVDLEKKKKKRTDSGVSENELGESGRVSSNGGGGESLSFRLGNLQKYVEGEQVAAG
ncbi:Protein IMPAIRED IN BABA-INDUCED STERILITY 1 [Camellia lanceoleosa]|uniref:Protein IMPAIRED IN BABA-INDUCED STERILITY 1 n=1 Tax=Camellia lanceoleosa TaxID=1840588 RepID=A0ACC0I621_9ERIC|nr:Protein IMPAIRED IN BABA-INDUCED STERILITY 1 [Camellia lanceoleosa]